MRTAKTTRTVTAVAAPTARARARSWRRSVEGSVEGRRRNAAQSSATTTSTNVMMAAVYIGSHSQDLIAAAWGPAGSSAEWAPGNWIACIAMATTGLRQDSRDDRPEVQDCSQEFALGRERRAAIYVTGQDRQPNVTDTVENRLRSWRREPSW